MKTMTLLFDEGMIELRFPSQDGTEYMSFDETKGPLCEMLHVPTDTSELTIDFEKECVEFAFAGERMCEERPGVADDENRILTLLGYKTVDMTNTVGLVNAFVNGEISENLFNLLFDLEGQENEANSGIAQFLKMLEQDESDL